MPDTQSIINRRRWEQKHRDAEFLGGPAPFLLECRGSLPPGRALDLACGLGANALYLAEEGFEVEAVDWSFEALRKLREAARELPSWCSSLPDVAFSPDGKWVASAGEDRTTRFWLVHDVTQTPPHERSHEEFLTMLRSWTNLRVVPDGSSSGR